MREMLSYSFVMPPTIFIVIGLLGSLLAFRRPRLGLMISLFSGIFLYGFSTPAVSMLLMDHLDSLVPTSADLADAQAIVVPSVDISWGNGADIPDAVGVQTLQRLAAAARLYRRLHFPIIVSGGAFPNHPNISAASLMRAELEQNFSVPVEFVDDASRNTFETGMHTAEILKARGMDRVIVVAQERDMPRLMWSVRKFGLSPVPYSLNRANLWVGGLGMLLPSAKAFGAIYYELHEIVGLWYYRLCY